jgi:hypothetical protein
MKKLKGSSNYLKNKTRTNLAKAILCLLILAAAFFALILRFAQTLQLDLLEETGLVFLLVPLIGFYFYLHKYNIYNGGLSGERQVAKLLESKLSDEYYLLNDLYLRDGDGDIDHVVLGPNGIFVLETKNWKGTVNCNGDEWQRVGKRNFSASPSRQVKRNALRVKQIIENSGVIHSGVWVEGIVVLTNNHATLRINGATVPVLKLAHLPDYLTGHRNGSFSRQQLEAMGKELTKQSH